MDGNLSDADKEIVKLVSLGFKAAVLDLAEEFKRWIGGLMIRAGCWAAVAAAIALIGWAIARSNV